MEKKAGIYALFSNGEIVYVGQSNNLTRRIADHIKDGEKEFDSFYAHETPFRKSLETELIDRFKPKYNFAPGKRVSADETSDIFSAMNIDEIVETYEHKRKGISVAEIAEDLETSEMYVYFAIHSHKKQVKFWKLFSYIDGYKTMIDLEWYKQNRNRFKNWIYDTTIGGK